MIAREIPPHGFDHGLTGGEPPDHLGSATFRADSAEITRALDAARATRSFASSELREAVARCARNARAGRLPPERLIVAVKAVVRDVGMEGVGEWFRDVVTDRAVAWAIEAYYDIDDR